MENIQNQSRRDFIKSSTAVGGGLTLGFFLPGTVSVATADAGGGFAMPNAWVKIGADNQITIMVARSEMGQDVSTSLPMLVCEELDVDVNTVKVEFAPPGEVYINSLLGGQLTGGSTSVRDAWEKLRKAGASARMMLVAAAAQEWGVDAGQVHAENGSLIGPGGKRMSYGMAAPKAAQLEVPKDVPLKPVSAFKVVGNVKQKRLDTPRKVKGAAELRHRHPRAGHAVRCRHDEPLHRRQGEELRRLARQEHAWREVGRAVQPRRGSGCRLVLAGEEGEGSAACRVGRRR